MSFNCACVCVCVSEGGWHGWSWWRGTLVCRAMERFARVRKTQMAALVLAISWTHRIGGLIEWGIKLTDRWPLIYTLKEGYACIHMHCLLNINTHCNYAKGTHSHAFNNSIKPDIHTPTHVCNPAYCTCIEDARKWTLLSTEAKIHTY